MKQRHSKTTYCTRESNKARWESKIITDTHQYLANKLPGTVYTGIYCISHLPLFTTSLLRIEHSEQNISCPKQSTEHSTSSPPNSSRLERLAVHPHRGSTTMVKAEIREQRATTMMHRALPPPPSYHDDYHHYDHQSPSRQPQIYSKTLLLGHVCYYGGT